MYREALEKIRRRPARWLVTGAAGFIGSNLVELLLQEGQEVVGLDNFATGHRRNIQDVLTQVGPAAEARFRFLEGDIRDLEICHAACSDVDYVLHQAALGSVPRSLENPIETTQTNVDGFVNVLVAARDAEVARVVYASSSATYGDDETLPKVEERVGKPLSPYAATKYTNELYADVFQDAYGLDCVGLRYFNVFGRRQDPEGAYAAVIPKWIGNLIEGDPCYINGDGETSRDFCYIDNALQANVLAAIAGPLEAGHDAYNVACGERTTLNELFRMIRNGLAERLPRVAGAEPIYRDFRPGDIRHSQADIAKIERDLGYHCEHPVEEGLRRTLEWYVGSLTDSVTGTGPGDAGRVKKITDGRSGGS